MDDRTKAWLWLFGALAVGAVAQNVAKREAAVLGLTLLEVAVLGLLVGSLATRKLT
jgi:hypothetical protein